MTKLREAWRHARLHLLADPLLLAALFAWVGYSTAGDAAGRKWWHLAVDAVALLWCAAFARSRFRALRLDPLALRAELRAAVRLIGKDELWVNRDEHLIFAARNGIEGMHLRVMDEDDFRAIDIDGSGAVVSSVFVMPLGNTAVWRIVQGVAIVTGEDGEPSAMPDRNGLARKWADAFRLALLTRRGLLHATPDEIRAVIGNLRHAERFDTTP